MKVIIIVYILINLSFSNKFGNSQKVAIIGKKLGGGLCSYFLHEMIPGIQIDIYDHQPKMETLFSLMSFNSHRIYINDIIKQKKVHSVYNNKSFIGKDSDKLYSSNIKASAGYETFHKEFEEYIMQNLQIFKQIYSHQKNGQTFKTVRELLRSLSTEFEDYFINETIENLLIKTNPLIAANSDIQDYIKVGLAGHFLNTNAHGFAGLCHLMFSQIIEELQQVSLQNTDLFIESLFDSDDKTIKKDVSIIIRQKNKNYVVLKSGKQIPYDFIILATTQVADVIEFEGFTDPVTVFKYRDAHIVHLTGRLSNKFIKISKDLTPIFDMQTTRMYAQIPYPNTTHYSIASLQQISKTDILQYVKPYKIKADFVAIAGPDYSVKDDESLRNAKFELGEHLYNAHALHSVSLVNEMLAIGAKNIALLIKNQIEEIGTFADEQNLSGEGVIISSSVVEQTINQAIDQIITSEKKFRSSTVRQRNNQSKSRKSGADRSKSKL